MNRSRQFSPFARQVSLSCLIAMLYVLIILLNGTPSLRFPVALILYSLLIHALNRAFLKKPRTVSQLALFNGVCGVLFYAGLIFTAGFGLVWQFVFGGFAVLLMTVSGAVSALHPVKLNGILLPMDANILFLIFSVLILGPLPHSFGWAAFAAVGALAGLLGSVSFRLRDSFGKREAGILLLLFAVIILIAWLLFSFVVSPLSAGVADLGKEIGMFFVFLGSQIHRFFRFLASLWHDDGTAGDLHMEQPSASAAEDASGSMQDNGIMPVIIIGVIVAAALILLLLLFKRTRKQTLRKRTLLRTAGIVNEKKTPLRDALWNVFNHYRRKLKTKQYLAAVRNQPEGIYFRLRKICRHTAFTEQPGDTPAEFLFRIRDAFSDAPVPASVPGEFQPGDAKQMAPPAWRSPGSKMSGLLPANKNLTAEQNEEKQILCKTLGDLARQLNRNLYAPLPDRTSGSFSSDREKGLSSPEFSDGLSADALIREVRRLIRNKR